MGQVCISQSVEQLAQNVPDGYVLMYNGSYDWVEAPTNFSGILLTKKNDGFYWTDASGQLFGRVYLTEPTTDCCRKLYMYDGTVCIEPTCNSGTYLGKDTAGVAWVKQVSCLSIISVSLQTISTNPKVIVLPTQKVTVPSACNNVVDVTMKTI